MIELDEMRVDPAYYGKERASLPALPEYVIDKYSMMTIEEMFEDNYFSLLAVNLRNAGYDMDTKFTVGKCRVNKERVCEAISKEGRKWVSVEYTVFKL